MSVCLRLHLPSSSFYISKVMYSTVHFVQLLRPQSILWTRLWLPQCPIKRITTYLIALNLRVLSYRRLSQLRGSHIVLYFAIYPPPTGVAFATGNIQTTHPPSFMYPRPTTRRCLINLPPSYEPPLSRQLLRSRFLLPWHPGPICPNRRCYNSKPRGIVLLPPPRRSLLFALLWDSQRA